jgi:hypothetical protein
MYNNNLRDVIVFSHSHTQLNLQIKAEASSKLQQWHPAQNLGKTMYSIVQKLMQEPPSLGATNGSGAGFDAAAAMSASAAPSSMAGGAVSYALSSPDNAYNGGGSAAKSSSSSSSVSVPPIPDSFPELQSMKPSQLGELAQRRCGVSQVFDVDGLCAQHGVATQRAARVAVGR